MQKIPLRRLLCYAFQIINLAHLGAFSWEIPPKTRQNALWPLNEICLITNITFTISFNGAAFPKSTKPYATGRVYELFSTTERVSQLAAERGLTVTQFAIECGLNRSTFCSTMRRGGPLKVDTIEQICNRMHITLGEFFTSPTQGGAANGGIV